MVKLGTKELRQFAAWPSATLHAAPNGPVVGIVMPRVSGHKEIHALYSPAHRKRDFPQADWAFLAHTAMNSAFAFDAFHQRGCVIGDVNAKNVLVSQKATVVLIDCDSYPIQVQGTYFPCEVGVPEYTPPELQGKPFKGVIRTANHDRFGLAVLIFHLLFMGRHPFVGRFLGRGDLPLEQAIAEYRFAFSVSASSLQMAPPPHSLPLNVLTPELAQLFDRAFGRSSHQPTARPQATEWAKAIAQFIKQLRRCPSDPGHLFPAYIKACPWHALMRAGSPNFFITVAAYKGLDGTSGGSFVLSVTWDQVERVRLVRTTYRPPSLQLPRPLVPRSIPTHLTTPLPPYVPTLLPDKVIIPRSLLLKISAGTALGAMGVLLIGCVAGKGLVLFGSLTLVIFGVLWLVLEMMRWHQQQFENADYRRIKAEVGRHTYEHDQLLAARREAWDDEKQERRHALEKARKAVDGAVRSWEEAAARYAQAFSSHKTKLTELKHRYLNLQAEQQAELRELGKNVEQIQLHLYLQSQFIGDSDIQGIGAAREAVLRSYGVETAYDVQQLSTVRIPGFGPKLTATLMNWRVALIHQFRFDPKTGIPPTELNLLGLKFQKLRQNLEEQLKKGPAELRAISAQAEQDLSRLESYVQGLMLPLTQAQINLALMKEK